MSGHSKTHPIGQFTHSHAFIVVHDDSKNACLGQNNVLAHEFGHLLGLAHEM